MHRDSYPVCQCHRTSRQPREKIIFVSFDIIWSDVWAQVAANARFPLDHRTAANKSSSRLSCAVQQQRVISVILLLISNWSRTRWRRRHILRFLFFFFLRRLIDVQCNANGDQMDRATTAAAAVAAAPSRNMNRLLIIHLIIMLNTLVGKRQRLVVENS